MTSMNAIENLLPKRSGLTPKTFVQECYMPQLNTTSITAGSQGYIQNTFPVLTEELDNDDDEDVQTVMTQMAVLTTQSQLSAMAANT